VSEQPGGPGWWIASDGRWYPPETAPQSAARYLTADHARALYEQGDRASDVMAALGPAGAVAAATPSAVQTCDWCGAPAQAGDEFCADCGAAVVAPAVGGTGAPPGSYRPAAGPVPQPGPTAAGGPSGGWAASPSMPPPGVPVHPGAYGVGPIDPRSGAPLADLGARFAAYLIDGGLFMGLFIAVVVFSGLVTAIVGEDGGAFLSLLMWLGIVGGGAWLLIVSDGGALGQTPGKNLMGIKVVGPYPGPLGYGKATVRWVGRMLDSIVCGIPIGLFWALFDPERRCWHDLVADTRVVVAPPTQHKSLSFWWQNVRS
jgi:uncharacterized RDD family membrane protein YckC